MASLGLGSFSRLPPEIRYLIWDELAPSGWQRQKTDLAILCTSKQLHAEIISHLHKVIKSIAFCIRPDYDREFPGFQMLVTNPNRLNKEAVDITSMWAFASAEDAINRGLPFLPLHIIPTVVFITPPNLSDPGQLICLCERIQQLVQLLQRTDKPIKSLTIDLMHKSSWISGNGEPRLSFSFPLTYRGDIGLTFIQSDVEAVLTPFYRLQNVQDVLLNLLEKLPNLHPQRFPTTRAWLTQVAESILPGSKPSITAKHRKLTDIFYFYLHLKMDILPGRTANILRLDRFAHWIERDYEERFSHIITEWPVECQIMDFVSFENTRRRYSFAHIQRHIVSGRSWKTLSLECRNKSRELSPDKWFRFYRGGLLPFNSRFPPEDRIWYPFHDFATLMKEEAIKRRARLSDSPVDPFLNNILETDERVARLKENLPDIEHWVMEECGIIVNFSGS
ncbi:hypothetical protein EIK77_010798 [Talaromyces pinophilus]|nr:hypothetical protein EIK77_010798 [Talaromyces pinophilus]